MATERTRSISFPVVERATVQLSGVPFSSNFKLKLSEYDATLADQNQISEMVLVLSWAYFEDHCKTIRDELLEKNLLPDWKEDYWKCGVGQWGKRLLSAQSISWDLVRGGEAAIIEASCLRNAIAHGQNVVSQNMINRITDCGAETSWRIGEPICVTFDKCEALRASLKSYARFIEGKNKPKAVNKAGKS